MNLRIIILIFSLTLLSNLSYSQADSLLGKQVTVHLHKTKKTVSGEYRSYKNNRVTVLFDNSLHDYFYPEVKLLQFEEFNLRFTEKGKLILDSRTTILNSYGYDDVYADQTSLPKSNPKIVNTQNKNSQKTLLLTEINGTKEFAINLNKKIKLILNDKTALKSNQTEILNDSTLSLYNKETNIYTKVSISDVYQIKCVKDQSPIVTGLGVSMIIVGVFTIPVLVGIPLLLSSKPVLGYRSKNMFFWKLTIKNNY